MNVVYLIGNGFDLNLGLKTSYSNFYKYYIAKKCNNDSIISFKNLLTESGLWSDMEKALGVLSAKFESPDEYRLIYNDVNNSLREYIEAQNERLHFSEAASLKLLEYLANPKVDLTPATKDKLTQYVNRIGGQWNVNVISFNYTYSFEQLLGDSIGKNIGKNFQNTDTILRGIQHVHGRCDETILLGVNSESQIANASFRADSALVRRLVKPVSNKTIEENVDDKCADLIRNAHLIICFGLSFGETDRIWWDHIKTALSLGRVLLIFDYRSGVDIKHNKFALGDCREETIKKIINNDASFNTDLILYSLNSEFFSGVSIDAPNEIPA